MSSLVSALPAREQRILTMRFCEEMTQERIAAEIGISQMQVSRLLRRALAQLRVVFSPRPMPHLRKDHPMHVVDAHPLSDEEATQIDAYWRAANYLSVGQIYLMGNPLLREPLLPEHVKPRLLGHWGTTPGLNLLYAHLNRIIAARGQDLIFVTGPGPRRSRPGRERLAGGHLHRDLPARSAADAAGMKRLFTQFSFPGGIPATSRRRPPGSIHEGGELGYSLSHAYGAAFDNPDLVVACVIGDGEAETGPLAASWHSNKFLDPVGDGAVLPILHLNGYKIANPTVLARIGDDELTALLTGYGHKPYLVAGRRPGDRAPTARRDPGRRLRRDRARSSAPPATAAPPNARAGR